MSLMVPDDPLAERIRECTLELLLDGGPGHSICPSEVAHLLAARVGGQWQDLMRPVRTVVASLCAGGVLDATQHEVVVDIQQARGPIRLCLRALSGRREGSLA